MKVYIIIWSDRHSDTTAHPFTDKDTAIENARSKAIEYCRYPDDYEEMDCSKINGWLFHATYSCEGDCLYVIEAVLDEALK